MNITTKTENLPAGTVITLKEITDLLEVQHSKAFDKVLKLSREPQFGEVSILDTLNLNGVKVETLALTKIQAIAAGAKLNNTLLMKLVTHLEKPMGLVELAQHNLELAILAERTEQAELDRKRMKQYVIAEHAPRATLGITEFSNNYLGSYKLSAQKINKALYIMKVFDGRYRHDPRFINKKISHQPSSDYREWFSVDKVRSNGPRSFVTTEVYDDFAPDLAVLLSEFFS